MTDKDKSNIIIEQLRQKMYEAYKNNESYERILAISQELDEALLENMRLKFIEQRQKRNI